MRIGICTNMLRTDGDPLGLRVLEAADEAGFDYLELPAAQMMDLPDRAFDALLKRLDGLRMRCAFANNMFPASLRLTGEAADAGAAERYLARLFPRLAVLGAKTVVFGSAGAKNVPEGFPKEEAFRQITALLRLAAGRCREHDVRVAIEPLNRGESNFILNIAEGTELMRAVGRPEVRMLADYYHHAVEDEAEEAVIGLGRDLIHAHIAEARGRVMPRRRRGEEYAVFFRSLRAAGYDGGVSLEAFSMNPAEELRSALAVLRESMIG